MADKRKLQAEIDRCIKKVQEGVEEFDEIWAKVQEATNANQKEKYEADLKKEIKKLQRLREQIKGWLNSNEIKDKSQLQEYRRVIEQKMEQFKVVERETKTKAYSKQGLGAEQKLDPKEKEKEDTIGWLQECIERLSTQNDKFESEIEQLSVTAGKKKKLDKDKQEKTDELKRHLEKHKFHIQKLELLMRLLTNNSLESCQVVKIREDLEYYITNNQEQEFEENDFMYDDLNLGDAEQQLGLDESENNSETNTTASVSPSSSPAPSHNSRDSNKGSDDIKLRHTSGEEVVKPLVSRTVSASASRSTPTTPLKFTSQTSVDSAVSTPPLIATPPPAPTGMSYNSVAAGAKAASASKVLSMSSRPTSEPPPAAPVFDSTPPKFEAPVPQVQQASTLSFQNLLSTTSMPAATPEVTLPTLVPASPTIHLPVVSSPVAEASTTNQSFSVNGSISDFVKQLNEQSSVMSLKSLAENVAMATNVSSTSPPTSNVATLTTVTSTLTSNLLQSANQVNSISANASSLMLGLSTLNSSTAALANAQQSQQTQDAKIPPSLGASPLGKIQLTQDHAFQLTALETAMHHMPMPADSERLRNYLPRSPCQVPAHYPQSPPPMADSLEYFNRLHNETLFFIFYYMEGTKAQYLAAKALKRQSWRFHTKYMMWFQRHEEPKTITDEFEQGTYIYFDFEKWAQRKKEGFMFEYRYLEDKEM